MQRKKRLFALLEIGGKNLDMHHNEFFN